MKIYLKTLTFAVLLALPAYGAQENEKMELNLKKIMDEIRNSNNPQQRKTNLKPGPKQGGFGTMNDVKETVSEKIQRIASKEVNRRLIPVKEERNEILEEKNKLAEEYNQLLTKHNDLGEEYNELGKEYNELGKKKNELGKKYIQLFKRNEEILKSHKKLEREVMILKQEKKKRNRDQNAYQPMYCQGWGILAAVIFSFVLGSVLQKPKS